MYCDDFQTDTNKTTIKDVVGDSLKTVEVPFSIETKPDSNYGASSVAGKFFIKPQNDNDGDYIINLPGVDDIGFAEWTGSAIKPEPVVYSKTSSGSTLLEIKKDYTLGYPDVDVQTGPNNRDMGTNKGAVYVYGAGAYEGKSGLVYFSIRKSIPRYIASTDSTKKITFNVKNGKYYSGSYSSTDDTGGGDASYGIVTADVTLSDATTGKNLVEGTDYSLSFRKESGSYATVTVTGMGNYFGTFTSGKFPLTEIGQTENKLAAPSGLAWSGTDKTTANWNKVDKADEYYVQIRVDYGSRKVTACKVTSDTSLELKNDIIQLINSINKDSEVSKVSFRVFAVSNSGEYDDSDWSDYSADSGYRNKSGEQGEEEDDIEEFVIPVKGKVTIPNPGFPLSKWKSSASGIAAVNSRGIVDGKNVGTVVITAVGKGSSPKTLEYKVTVEKPVWPKATLYTNDSFSAASKISGVDKLQAIHFATSDNDILDINEYGKVTVKKNGKAKLTTYYKYGSVSTTYTVKMPSIKQTALTMLEGQTKKLSLVNSSKNIKVSYESSAPKKVYVSDKGVVSSLTPGTATIKLLVNGKEYSTCKVTVKTPGINQERVTVKKKKTVQLKITNKSKNITFNSSDDKVATVTKGGKVKGVSKGQATISIMVNGVVYDTCKVYVNE